MTTTVHARHGEMSLSFVREFEAPAALLFRAHTEQALFAQWIGPRGSACQFDHFTAAIGGSFRYTVGAGVSSFTFFGSYHEVTAPTRLVHTWEFEGEPGRPTLESLTFVDLPGGRCRLEGLSIYTSREHCAETLEWDLSGNGMDENFARLDELLPTLA
jgi:uncharacterized protein YndB with AHSA1/START domain